MKILIITALCLAALCLAGLALLALRLRDDREKIEGIYHAIDRNNERLFGRCSDLEGRAKALEERADAIEKALEDDEASGRSIEKAIVKGLDSIFNYSLDTAMNGGVGRE